ncbi:MAG TPA: DNA polymerase III subunit delta [bacterium]|nr:DNA polymerase III subunit delta [bacterium]
MDIGSENESKIFKTVAKPVYVCHGEYEFLQKELADKIVKYLLKPDEIDVSLVKINASEPNALETLLSEAGSRSLFSDNRVIYVDNAENLKLLKSDRAEEGKKLPPEEKYTNWKQFEAFSAMMRKPPESARMIFVCGEELRKPSGKGGAMRTEKIMQRVYEDVAKTGVIVRFARMYDEAYTEWIVNRARREGLRLTIDQADRLLDMAGKDVRHLANEVEKLAVRAGDSRQISDDDMRMIVTSSDDIYLYLMIDNMMSGKGRSALVLLDRSMEAGGAPAQIIGFLASRFRQLWQARYLLDKGYFSYLPKEFKFGGKKTVGEGMAAVTQADRSTLCSDPKSSILGKTEFAAYNMLIPARRMTLRQIEGAMTRIVDIERRMKGIDRPKLGSDVMMIQNLIVDISRDVKSAAVPN